MAELFDSLAGRTLFAHFCAALNCIFQPTSGVNRRVSGPIVADKSVKIRHPRSDHSREIPPKAVRRDIFDRSLNFDNHKSEVTSDLISGMAVQYLCVDVHVKFGYSRLSSSDVPFSTVFRTLITSYLKRTVTSYPVWL